MDKRIARYFTIKNRIDELPLLAKKIEKLAGKLGWDFNLSMSINLVLEEALSNVIFYGFNDSESHDIKLSVSQNGRKLTIKITDNGKPFDPSAQRQPEIDLPAEERPIGGLGIFLIKKIMDEVHYTRDNQQNKLTLIKYT